MCVNFHELEPYTQQNPKILPPLLLQYSSIPFFLILWSNSKIAFWIVLWLELTCPSTKEHKVNTDKMHHT